MMLLPRFYIITFRFNILLFATLLIPAFHAAKAFGNFSLLLVFTLLLRAYF